MNVVWRGTNEEAYDLIQAIENNCDCKWTDDTKTQRIWTCDVHTAFIKDQGWLDRLLIQRRNAEILKGQEGEGEPPASHDGSC